MRNPVVVITAGAGYGKTRAVYSFAQKHNIPAIWVQLSEHDNNSEHFWENFTESVSLFNAETAARLIEIGFPSTERLYNRCLSISGDGNSIPPRHLIVFDDVHLISEKNVLNFIERICASLHPNVNLLLLARSEPAVNFDSPVVPCVRITEGNLRFTREETEEYFILCGLHPDSRTVSCVYNDTEGWIFAIHLAALSLKNNGNANMYVPSALRSNIFKLLECEIVSGFSAKFTRFLIKLSLIDTPVTGLLREIAVSDNGDSSLLDEMGKACSFIRYDPYLDVCHIHQLFLDYLRGRQHELSDIEKNDTWNKAALWCVKNNHRIAAIRYFEKAGNYSGILQAADTFSGILPTQTAGMLLDVLDNAPAKLYETHPEVYFVRTRAQLVLEKFDTAESELKAIITKFEKKYKESKSKKGCCNAAAVQAKILAGCYNNLGFLHCVTCIYTHNYGYAKYFKKAYAYSQLFNEMPSPQMSVMYLPSYVCRACEAKEMENFIRAFIQMNKYIPDIQNGCGYGSDDLIKAEFAFYKGDIREAEELSGIALGKARERNQCEIENRALFFLLRIAMYRGNNTAISEIFRQLDAQLEQSWYVNRYFHHDIITGWYYVRTGRSEKMAEWLKSKFDESDLSTTVMGMEILLKSRYHFAENRFPAALAVLEKDTDKKYSNNAFLLGKLERKVLEAVCRYRMDDHAGAFRDLEKAWEYASLHGLWMPFAELGKDMRSLAQAALKEPSIKIPAEDLKIIIRKSAFYAKNLFFVVSLIEDPVFINENISVKKLSEREKDVLAGLSQGLTRIEIAKTSSISVNTVKSVINAIYSKLGAVNRADAIRIASEYGVLYEKAG